MSYGSGSEIEKKISKHYGNGNIKANNKEDNLNMISIPSTEAYSLTFKFKGTEMLDEDSLNEADVSRFAMTLQLK